MWGTRVCSEIVTEFTGVARITPIASVGKLFDYKLRKLLISLFGIRPDVAGINVIGIYNATSKQHREQVIALLCALIGYLVVVAIASGIIASDRYRIDWVVGF